MIKEYRSKPGVDISIIPRTSLHSLFNRRGSVGKKDKALDGANTTANGSMSKLSPKSKQLHHSVTEIPAPDDVKTEDMAMTAPVANNLKNLQKRFAKQQRDSVSTTYIMNDKGEIGIKKKFANTRGGDAVSQQPASTKMTGFGIQKGGGFFDQNEKTSLAME